MGGAEIVLTQSDLNSSRVELEITQVFGGTKIIVPPHWKVSSDLVAIFGGIEDRRPLMSNQAISDEKHLVIKGTSIFGGIDIRSY
jgi:predicted membrane protein